MTEPQHTDPVDRPEQPLVFGPGTALVVVDVQNDFADPSGSLHVAGGADIVEPVNALVRVAELSGASVVYTQDWHPEQTPHFVDDGGVWPRHCVRNTWGAELHPDLVVDGPVVRKGTNGEDGYSGFTMRDPTTGSTMPTELQGLLEERGVERTIVVGLALDVCVKATALDAVDAGFAVTVVADACRAVDLEPGDGERAIAEMADRGVVVV